jgi:hypothetical protein
MKPLSVFFTASLLAVTTTAGCGLGAGKGEGVASLNVTADFGSTSLGKVAMTEPTSSETAMRQLQRMYSVDTSFGGRFVKSIGSRSGGSRGGRPVDWFYFVNGTEAPVGAADTLVRKGDSVWWDYRDWGAATHVPAVVGSWPHPFTGIGSNNRPPVRILCTQGADAACTLVEKQLAAVGVRASRGTFGSGTQVSGIRVLVGDWKGIRSDPAAQLLEQGPAASGVYIKPAAAGNAVSVLNPSGNVARSLGKGSSFVAATLLNGGLPTWIVSGTDAGSVASAASRLTESDLHLRYAVAWVGKRAYPAPQLQGR